MHTYISRVFVTKIFLRTCFHINQSHFYITFIKKKIRYNPRNWFFWIPKLCRTSLIQHPCWILTSCCISKRPVIWAPYFPIHTAQPSVTQSVPEKSILFSQQWLSFPRNILIPPWHLHLIIYLYACTVYRYF